jgi:hypothetical protein
VAALSDPEPHITRLAYVSDLHTNSTVAVCPPVISLDNGGTYHASRGQRWLWECLNDFANRFHKLPGRHIVGLGGDLGELDIKRRTVELITPNKATIQDIAIETTEPLVGDADGVIVVRGTPAHQGKGAWLEEAIAQDLTNAIRQSKKIASWYQFQGCIDQGRFDMAHHASMGNVPATAAIRVAEAAVRHYLSLGQPLPHVILRSHNHRKADSGDNYPFKVFFTPSFSLKTEFAYRQGRELQLSDIGGLIFTIEGDRVSHEWVLYEPRENKRVWAVKI